MSSLDERNERISWAVPVVHSLAWAESCAAILSQPDPTLLCNPTSRGIAKECEAACGWSPSVYFYAGVCYPCANGIAVAYRNDKLEGMTGGTTPFDSGGVYISKIAVDLTDTGCDSTASYLQAQDGDLLIWRDSFAAHLKAYFDDPTAYFDDERGPQGSGPGRSFELNLPPRDKRLWSMELRCYGDVSFRDKVLRWSCGVDVAGLMDAMLTEGDPAWRPFLNARHDIGYATAEHFQYLERWIARFLEIL